MKRLPAAEFERLCQKPDHRRVGNWMARHVTRPAALQITRAIAPSGVSAHAVTLLAWAWGTAGAAAFAWGSVWGWLLGAVMLQVWYLLDHVDGQIARLRGTASLDGVQLDYLMHHTVNLLVPLGVGYGLFARTGEPLWQAGGLVWGVALLLITLQHDARYKTFIKRLKRVHGTLHVCGGAGGRPSPQPPIPRHPLRLATWAARKLCETHVLLNVLALTALGQLLAGDERLLAGSVCLATLSPVALAVAAWSIGRSLHSGSAEKEFATWYHVPPGCELVFADGWWLVESAETKQVGQSADCGSSQSS